MKISALGLSAVLFASPLFAQSPSGQLSAAAAQAGIDAGQLPPAPSARPVSAGRQTATKKPAGKVCGLSAGIDSRINDCATAVQTRQSLWRLVSRTQTKDEFWLDTKTGLIWVDAFVPGHDMAKDMNYFAKEKCAHYQGLPGLTFYLPEISAFADADTDGSRQVLPSRYTAYPSATVGTDDWGGHQVLACYNSRDGSTNGLTPLVSMLAVRCATRKPAP